MFFALFGITSKFSQFLGPALIGIMNETIINPRWGFVLCTVFQLLPIFIVGYVNMSKAEIRLKLYEERERRKSNPLLDQVDNSSSVASSLHAVKPEPSTTPVI